MPSPRYDRQKGDAEKSECNADQHGGSKKKSRFGHATPKRNKHGKQGERARHEPRDKPDRQPFSVGMPSPPTNQVQLRRRCVRYRMNSGQDLLTASLSTFDPLAVNRSAVAAAAR